MSKLTPKQRRFVDEYLVDLNATQAAIRAGYSPKTANEQGARLLAKVSVHAAIAERMKARQERTEITQDRVLKEMAKLAFFDARKFFTPDGRPIELHLLDDETAGAVVGLEVFEEFAGVGDARQKIGEVKKYKLADKKGALEAIGRHLGMFPTRVENTGPGGGPIQTIAAAVTLAEVEEAARSVREKF